MGRVGRGGGEALNPVGCVCRAPRGHQLPQGVRSARRTWCLTHMVLRSALEGLRGPGHTCALVRQLRPGQARDGMCRLCTLWLI